MGIFPDAQGHLTAVCGSISPNFELIQAFMAILVTYKNEGDTIKNGDDRVVTRLYIYLFPRANSLDGHMARLTLVRRENT